MESKGTHMFWGIFFLAIGVLMLVNYVFGVNLPMGRVVVSLVVIYIGMKMLFGAFELKISRLSTANEAIFATSHFSLETELKSKHGKYTREYNTVFGNGELDLTDIDLSKGPVNLEINTVFGETRLIVKKGTPVRIKTNAVFGSSSLPDGTDGVVGKFKYKSEGVADATPAITIDSNVVFGSFKVIER